jgi:hypothetical protein
MSSSPGSASVTPKLAVNFGSPLTVMAASSCARTVLGARLAPIAEQSENGQAVTVTSKCSTTGKGS